MHHAKVRAVFSPRASASTRRDRMALPPATPDRQPKHRRGIDVQVFARADGLWEVDARLTDTKSQDCVLASGIRPAGSPVHDMLLRLVVDDRLVILEAGASALAMPYPGLCDAYGDAYGRLVGLSLLRGFRRAVLERLGGVRGCTHVTELAQVLPTAVIQALAGEVIDTQEGRPNPDRPGSELPPFQIDRCHALRRDAEAVRLYYPRWYRATPEHNPQGPAGGESSA